jgi:hypothetical protein
VRDNAHIIIYAAAAQDRRQNFSNPRNGGILYVDSVGSVEFGGLKDWCVARTHTAIHSSLRVCLFKRGLLRVAFSVPFRQFPSVI